MSTLQALLDGLNSLLANEAARSIAFGWIISLCGTQYLKFRVWMPRRLRDEFRIVVQLASLPLGFLPVWFTWPDRHTAAWAALSVGLTAPFVYQLGLRLLLWKWPELESTLSATPRTARGSTPKDGA